MSYWTLLLTRLLFFVNQWPANGKVNLLLHDELYKVRNNWVIAAQDNAESETKYSYFFANYHFLNEAKWWWRRTKGYKTEANQTYMKGQQLRINCDSICQTNVKRQADKRRRWLGAGLCGLICRLSISRILYSRVHHIRFF